MHLPKTLLLVDDDSDDQEIFKLALEKLEQPVQLLTAGNGHEAMLLLQSGSRLPDYMFVDLNMPRMGGLQLLEALKKEHHLKDIPVVIYSTSANPMDVEKATQLGAIRFMTKPSRFTELCQLLQNHLLHL